MSKHSPGPWRYDDQAVSDLIVDARGTAVWIGEVGFMGLEANRRLIARAPELLAMLKEALTHVGCGRLDADELSAEFETRADALIREIDG